MIQIRQFMKDDLKFVSKEDKLLALSLQYNKDYPEEYALTAEEDGQVVGVAVARKHFTWDSPGAKVHKLVAEFCTEQEEVQTRLITALKKRVNQIQADNPGKNVALVTTLEADNINEGQLYLKQGFLYGEILPVLGFDLKEQIRHYELPEEVTIKQVPDDKNIITQYIQATGEANKGIFDSMSQFCFQKNDPSFATYMAVTDTGRIVGGISIWNVTEDRSATENIFVVPDYRRKNIARELIATAFEQIRQRGMSLATLSMLGTNRPAMRLYQSTGYRLQYELLELLYTPEI